MNKVKSLKEIVSGNLCLGCGLCSLNLYSESAPVKLKYSKGKGHLVPLNKNRNSLNYDLGFKLCPGKGYKINTLAQSYNFSPNFNAEIGYYHDLNAVTSSEKEVLKNASSSGIMTSIILYLLEIKEIDKAIVTKFIYTENGPKAIAFATNRYEEIVEAQGSKYCPVDLADLITELKKNNGKERYAFIGTPCLIASLRNIQTNILDLGIKYFIGNFCGGFKSQNNFNRLITLNKVQPKEVKYFRFRGAGQPGSMQIKTENKTFEMPYPEYVKMTGYSKLKRCHLCVDATAELADFSCGDAWLPKYAETNIPTSIVICRTKEASDLLNKIAATKAIFTESINETDIIKSQKGNIKSKKHRQAGRIALYKRLGKKIPEITEGYKENEKYSMLLEINIFISHLTKLLFENIGLFMLFYYKNSIFKKVMFKLFRDNYN